MGYNLTANRDQFDAPARRDDLSSLGTTLSDLRKRAVMTQETAAAKIPISTQSIRNREVGRHEPDPTKLRALAQPWRVSEDDILHSAQNADPIPFRNRTKLDPDLLKRARLNAQLSPATAASATALHPTTIGRHERGCISPTNANLETTSTLYGRPTRWFLRQERTRRPQTSTNNR